MVAMVEEQKAQQVHTFQADTLRAALADVRAALGPDAMIIDQQRVGTQVRVRAALDVIEPLPELMVQPVLGAMPPQPTPQSKGERRQTVAPAEAPAEAENTADVTARLRALGYESSVIAAISAAQSVDAFRQALIARLNYARRKPEQLLGCYRFVGACGVGKTSSLIKVLSRWVAHNGPGGVAVVSTDTARLAATEPLQLACHMLNVAVYECTPGELQGRLDRLCDRRLVLIDGPGLAVRSTVQPIEQVKDVWVCSALHASANLVAQREQIQGLNLTGVLLSQVDQLVAGDELANLLFRWRDPLLWLGNGPQLPDAMLHADEQALEQALFATSMGISVQVTI